MIVMAIIFKLLVIGTMIITVVNNRIHKWPLRGTVWNLAHEIEVGKASVK